MSGAARAAVVLIDPDSEARARTAEALGETRLRVVDVDTAGAFLSVATSAGPPCAVIDANLPDMTCHQLQAEVSRRALGVPLVFMVNQDQVELAISLLKAGAVDVLVKPVGADELRRRILRVLASVAREKARVSAANDRLGRLTERELEVVLLSVNGRSNSSIAASLSISVRTVEVHRRNAMRKTGSSNTVQLAHFVSTARKADLATAQRLELADSKPEGMGDDPASTQLSLWPADLLRGW